MRFYIEYLVFSTPKTIFNKLKYNPVDVLIILLNHQGSRDL